MKKIFRFISWILSALASITIIGAMGGVAAFYYFSQDLPDYTNLANYHPATPSRLYASDGSLLAEFAHEKRIFLSLEQIPPKLINAFIAAEDKNFYSHPGVDFIGVLRAMRENINNIGKKHSLVGGSTITQQVVKNFLLTNEKSFSRKAKEAILAFRISRVFSKGRILELYLNEIYLGMGAYGVESAAKIYFGKKAKDLSTEEIALLAGMPKAPSAYNPKNNPKKALKRRNYVIRRMLEDGYINQAESIRALSTKIKIIKKSERLHQKIKVSGYFAEEVRRNLIKKYGEKLVYGGGLFIRSTLDPKLQKLADISLQKALESYDRRHGYRGAISSIALSGDWKKSLQAEIKTLPILLNGDSYVVVLSMNNKENIIGFVNGKKSSLNIKDMTWAKKQYASGRLGKSPKKPADIFSIGDIIIVRKNGENEKIYQLYQIPEVNGALLAMDPYTGKILAMSGGYSAKISQFNRATQAKRQPGSAFKPFVYLAGLEHGFTPATIIEDKAIEINQGKGLPVWKPKNYEGTFLGPATLRTGLEKSRNLMTIRLAQMVGLPNIIEIGKRFNIYDNMPENYSMALGSQETTLLRMVNAYAMIANGGIKISPIMIEQMDDRYGRSMILADKRICDKCNNNNGGLVSRTNPPNVENIDERVIDPRIAYQLIYMMQGVVQRGTAARASRLGLQLAGKTGTTNDSRDAWFMGYSPSLVIGVFIGFDNPRTLGHRETGSRVALPAFINFMKYAMKDREDSKFYVPSGISFVNIDQKTGMPPLPWNTEQKIIKEAFLSGGTIFIPNRGELELNEMDSYDYNYRYGKESDGMNSGYLYDQAGGYDPYADDLAEEKSYEMEDPPTYIPTKKYKRENFNHLNEDNNIHNLQRNKIILKTKTKRHKPSPFNLGIY